MREQAESTGVEGWGGGGLSVAGEVAGGILPGEADTDTEAETPKTKLDSSVKTPHLGPMVLGAILHSRQTAKVSCPHPTI